MLKSPLTENYQRLCWIDGDIYVTTTIRDPFSETGLFEWELLETMCIMCSLMPNPILISINFARKGQAGLCTELGILRPDGICMPSC
jgi:hypothetical protein